MPSIYKVLGQVAPVADTETTLYTVPSGKSAVCSTLTICNRGISAMVRVAVCPAGAATSDAHYIVYDCAVNQYDSVYLTIGVTLVATDVVKVYANTGTVSFGLFGSEVS